MDRRLFPGWVEVSKVIIDHTSRHWIQINQNLWKMAQKLTVFKYAVLNMLAVVICLIMFMSCLARYYAGAQSLCLVLSLCFSFPPYMYWVKLRIIWDVLPCSQLRTWQHIPEDSELHTHCRENLKSQILDCFLFQISSFIQNDTAVFYFMLHNPST
jgi:hypothetical protein